MSTNSLLSKKSPQMKFTFSSNSTLILNNFSNIKTNNIEEIAPKKIKKIIFKESEEALDIPIPGFNSDNKQKIAHLKLNKPVKGILRKYPKYLIPQDILTEQIKKYENFKESLLEQETEKTNPSPANIQNNEETIDFFSEQKGQLFFKNMNFNYSKKIKEKENEIKTLEQNNSNKEKDNNNNIEILIKKSEKKIFTSIVNEILNENPFSKLNNKNELNESEEIENQDLTLTPFYKIKEPEILNEKFLIPQLPYNFQKKNINKDNDLNLFNYDKTQKKKLDEWEFKDEKIEKTKIIEQEKEKIEEKKSAVIEQMFENTQTADILNLNISLKLKNEINNQPLKDWNSTVSYNFSLNVSKDVKSHVKAKSDMDSFMKLISSPKRIKKEKPQTNENPKIEKITPYNSLINLKFFLKNYIGSQSNPIFFEFNNKTIMKHDLDKNLYKFNKIENNEIFRCEYFSFCYYNQNSIFISGGIDPIFGEVTNKSYIYNMDEKEFIIKNPMKISRYNHQLFFYKNIIYCIGGLSSEEKMIKSCEKYENGEWINIANMKMKRNFLRACLSETNGFIYVLGTQNEDSKHLIFIVEKYDIINNNWKVIHLKNELIITNLSRMILLCRNSHYSNKIIDEILIFDKDDELNTILLDIENEEIVYNLEFKLDPQKYILPYNNSLFIFHENTFEECDKLFFNSTYVEPIQFTIL